MPNPPIGAILDGNTIALYRCDEATAASNLIDAGGSFDLTQTGSPVVSVPPFCSIGGGREITGLTQGFTRPATPTNVSDLAGECTLEFWVYWNSGPLGSTGFFFPFNCATSAHLVFYVDIIPDTSVANPGSLRSYWHSGANGTAPQFFQTTDNFLVPHVLTHVAVRHRLVSGSRIVDVFKNGVPHSSSGALPVPSTTFAGTADLNAHTNGPAYWGTYVSNGVLDDVRISKVARSDAEILATYTNGLNTTPFPQWAKLSSFPDNTTDHIFVALRSHMLSNGWTEIDVLSSTVNARDVVFKGGERTPGVGDCAFLRLRSQVTGTPFPATQTISAAPYSDWDVSTHTGMNIGDTGTSGLKLYSGNFNYVICRANSQAIALHSYSANNGYSKMYAGFLQRGLPAPVNGITKLSAGISAGVSVLPIAIPITPYVGQKLQIMNYAHNSASANASHVEQVTVLSSTPTTITISGTTAFAYDIGALVGENVFPNVSWPFDTGVGYAPFDSDGARGTSAGARLSVGSLATGPNWRLGDNLDADTTPGPNTYTGRLPTARLALYTLYHVDSLPAHGTIGVFYHLLSIAKENAVAFNLWDKIEDIVTGDRYWIIPDSTGSVGSKTLALGPGAPTAGAGAGTYKILTTDGIDVDSGVSGGTTPASSQRLLRRRVGTKTIT